MWRQGPAAGFDRDGDYGRDGVDGAHWWERWEDTGRGAKRKRGQDRVPDEEEAVWRKQLEQQPLQASCSSVDRLRRAYPNRECMFLYLIGSSLLSKSRSVRADWRFTSPNC